MRAVRLPSAGFALLQVGQPAPVDEGRLLRQEPLLPLLLLLAVLPVVGDPVVLPE
jgi:hypothetical protein